MGEGSLGRDEAAGISFAGCHSGARAARTRNPRRGDYDPRLGRPRSARPVVGSGFGLRPPRKDRKARRLFLLPEGRRWRGAPDEGVALQFEPEAAPLGVDNRQRVSVVLRSAGHSNGVHHHDVPIRCFCRPTAVKSESKRHLSVLLAIAFRLCRPQLFERRSDR
jgi:hypothetical protein